MKLATYRTDASVRIGIVDAQAGKVFDLAAAARRDGLADAPFASMLSLIDADDRGLELARGLVAKRKRRSGSLEAAGRRRTAGAAAGTPADA